MGRSRGSLELSRLGTGAEISRRTGKDQGYISRILSGRQKPSRALKEEFAKMGGPDPIAWDEELPEPEIRRPMATDEPAPVPTADNVRDLAGNLMRTIKQLEQEISNSELSLYERIRYAEKLASVTVDLGKLTGATILNGRMILMSPVWLQIEEVILESLQEVPGALEAFRDGLQDAIETGRLK